MRTGSWIAGIAFLLAGTTGAVPGLGPRPAMAGEYKLCNQTGYILDTALAVQASQTTAAQGWFRIYPGQCQVILSRTLEGERYLVYTRTPDAYDNAPVPEGASDLACVARDDFLIAGAERCADPGNRLVSFSDVTEDATGELGQTILTGQSNMDMEQARIAGLQRLLVIANFDPGDIDGNDGEETERALDAFRQRVGITASATDAALFEALLAAAVDGARANGLTYCNDTEWTIFAAAGITKDGATNVEGWFELPAGDCVQAIREPLSGDLLHSFAQAHDGNGFPVIQNGVALRWGGTYEFCTKPTQFEISEHSNCRARGLDTTGFTADEIGDSRGRVIRFRVRQ